MANVNAFTRLEMDLIEHIIEEKTHNNIALRGAPELTKYRGLTISPDKTNKDENNIISIRIGALEAKYRVATGEKIAGRLVSEDTEKVSGALVSDDETIVMHWLRKKEIVAEIKRIFMMSKSDKKTLTIVPFDLEEVFEQD